MTTHLGFYNTSSTRTHVRFQFSTHAGAGANVAPLSAFEAADLRIYRAADGAAFSATQRSSSNGITMTSPFDSLTGYHDVDIDLTDNTDAGFYASGYLYLVVLAPDTETIDSQTITGIPLEYFEIGVQPVNVTQLGGSAIDQSGGLINANVKQISTDATAADNAEAFFDGTGYAGTNNVIPLVTVTTTATNLTNAPTNGDLTAAMKASVNAEADTALADYDAPTHTELTAELALADDVVLATIAALNDLSQADVRSAVGLASADLDTQLDALPTATENADALLKRDWTSVSGAASRSVLNALRFIRNKFSTTAHAGKVTVYEEDDTTEAYQKDVTTDAAAEPIVEG